MVDGLTAFIASETYLQLTIASGPPMVVWYVIQMRREQAERLRRWRENGDRAAMPFHARLAERLRKMDGPDR